MQRYIDETHEDLLRKNKEFTDLRIEYNIKNEKENLEKSLLTSTAVSAAPSTVSVASSTVPISTTVMAKSAVTTISVAASVPDCSTTRLGSTATSAVLPTTAITGKVEPVTHHNVASTSTYGVKMPT